MFLTNLAIYGEPPCVVGGKGPYLDTQGSIQFCPNGTQDSCFGQTEDSLLLRNEDVY